MSAMGTPSPLPPSSSSMATPSTGPRLSTRKRNSSSSSAGRTTLIETAEMTTTPARRTSRDLSSSSFKENDPSAVVMMSGTMELATEENVSDHRQVSEHGSLLRSSAKTMNGKAVENPNVSGTKPKALKLSLQATPSTKNRSNTVSRPRLVKDIFSRSSLLFLSFILIAGLVTTFYGSTTHPPSFEGMSMEGQVAELEEILRKTTKMMQVQLDLVDMKIHKEVDGLRKELEDKIDEQTISFGTELKNMKARTEDIEASLKTFIDAGFPTRHDVLNLITSIVEQRASEGTGDALSLDDVRAVARRIVEAELDKHAADGIGRVDYALTSGGGKVIDHSEGFYHGLKFGWQQLVGSFLPGGNHKHSLANKILEPSFGEPGQCLPLKGNNVYVDIALRTSVFPDAFSLEHVSKVIFHHRSNIGCFSFLFLFYVVSKLCMFGFAEIL